uniref:laccase n=1 Tax=Phylloporia weberiana TaxID=1001332 RepID=U3PH31_9AGAM|nr:laccase [Ganoderma weberianum]
MAGLRSLLSYLPLLFSASAYAAIGPVGTLTISNADTAPDGFTRSAVVVNGESPGPLITGNKGDRFQINVVNQLTNHTMSKTTSVHWHGLFQEGTNWADGPAFVTQCPIASGDSFLYDFRVPDQAGTFWYHSHLSTQYCDGLRGPLVVYDPHDPLAHMYDVDDESTVITLTEWYHIAAELGPRFPAGDANSTLINGMGRSIATPTADLAVVNVTQGKRYRFRLISMACDPSFTFSIDGHDLTVIEADGIETKPVTVNTLNVFAAQRYSFVLTANQTVDNYWIRANPVFGDIGFEGGLNSAILRYDGAAPIEPVTSQQSTQVLLNETDLHPYVPRKTPGKPVKGGVDLALNMAFGFNTTDFFINNSTFVSPTVPVLLQILSGTQSALDLMPQGNIYKLPKNASIEITFPANANAAGSPHPFHLHGHSFAVIRSAGSTVYNYHDPVWRDTVSTGIADDADNVTIRFQTDNPGPWFLHCHIDFHLKAGFAVVLAEDVPDIPYINHAPPAWSNLCPTYDALSPDDQ